MCNLISQDNGRTQIEGVLNAVFMRIFGTKREEVTGGWRKLHN
jgi:hypothetical protein